MSTEDERTEWYELGITSGWDRVYEYLKALSTTAWEKGEHKTAKNLWDLSIGVRSEAEKLTRAYREKYPK